MKKDVLKDLPEKMRRFNIDMELDTENFMKKEDNIIITHSMKILWNETNLPKQIFYITSFKWVKTYHKLTWNKEKEYNFK